MGAATLHDVLDEAEAGALLRLEPAAVVACCEAGELPGRKLGGAWRFSRAALLSHLAGDAPPMAGQGIPTPPIEAARSTIDPKTFEASLRERLRGEIEKERAR